MRLAPKVLIVLSVPVVLQLFLSARLADFYQKAEEDKAKITRARNVSAQVNLVLQEAFKMSKIVVYASERHDASKNGQYFELKSRLHSDVKKLQDLVADNQQDKAIVDDLVAANRRLEPYYEDILNNLLTKYKKGSPEQLQITKRIRAETPIVDRLRSIANMKQTAAMARSYEAKMKERSHRILIENAATSVVMLVIVGLFLKIHVVGRLSIILENSRRFISREPLRMPIRGTDEIAALDRAVHRMFDNLQDLSKEEKDSIELASDMICVLDGNLNICDANKATASLLLCKRKQLIGSNFFDLVLKDDRDIVETKLALIKEGVCEPPFEARFQRRGGAIVDVLLSLMWSEEERTFFLVGHEITERKQAERLQKEVVQMVSHDLRSPLMSIRGILELFDAGVGGDLDHECKKLLEIANRNSNLMLSLVNDILDIEKLEAGALQLDRKIVPVDEILNQSIETTTAIARQKGVVLEQRLSEQSVYADKDRLVQVLVNLITNAIKFSDAGTTITLSAESRDGRYLDFEVIDRGRGIPAYLLDSIFDRFKQVETGDAKYGAGFGLGLAICKALVELHGGAIEVQSEVGKGSCFRFSIPANDAVLSLAPGGASARQGG